MKKFLLVIVTMIVLVSCSSNEHFVIKGTLEGASGEIIYLQQNTGSKLESIDSVDIVNGSFEFIGGSVEVPAMYYISVEGKRGSLGFFLENTELTVNGHIDTIYSAIAAGSPSQDQYNAYNESLRPYYEKNSALFQELKLAREAGDEEMTEKLSNERKDLSEQIRDFQIEFVKANSESFVTPTILRSISYSMETDELEGYINGLDEKVAASQIVKDLVTRIEALRKVDLGMIAPDFTQNDINGNPVTLSEIKGHKLLLVDFWAAWCGPCRDENPNVVAVYNEFHEKGFDVLGVSLDNEEEAWKQAIEDDHLLWTQLSDLGGWGNSVAKQYAVNSIPANFLLDADGKIIAKGLRGEKLKEKVAELLAE